MRIHPAIPRETVVGGQRAWYGAAGGSPDYRMAPAKGTRRLWLCITGRNSGKFRESMIMISRQVSFCQQRRQAVGCESRRALATSQKLEVRSQSQGMFGNQHVCPREPPRVEEEWIRGRSPLSRSLVSWGCHNKVIYTKWLKKKQHGSLLSYHSSSWKSET